MTPTLAAQVDERQWVPVRWRPADGATPAHKHCHRLSGPVGWSSVAAYNLQGCKLPWGPPRAL